MHMHVQIEKQTDGPTDGRTGRQTYGNKNIHMHMHTYTHIPHTHIYTHIHIYRHTYIT